MTTSEQDIGALKADMANVKADVTYIREHMVTRREFEATAYEHKAFRKDITALQLTQAHGALLRKWGERLAIGLLSFAVYCLIGVKI